MKELVGVGQGLSQRTCTMNWIGKWTEETAIYLWINLLEKDNRKDSVYRNVSTERKEDE